MFFISSIQIQLGIQYLLFGPSFKPSFYLTCTRVTATLVIHFLKISLTIVMSGCFKWSLVNLSNHKQLEVQAFHEWSMSQNNAWSINYLLAIFQVILSRFQNTTKPNFINVTPIVHFAFSNYAQYSWLGPNQIQIRA